MSIQWIMNAGLAVATMLAISEDVRSASAGCENRCAVVGGCCPKSPYGFTETHWSRWPGTVTSDGGSLPADIRTTAPPTKGEELRDREVREDRKKSSRDIPATSLPMPTAPRSIPGQLPVRPQPQEPTAPRERGREGSGRSPDSDLMPLGPLEDLSPVPSGSEDSGPIDSGPTDSGPTQGGSGEASPTPSNDGEGILDTLDLGASNSTGQRTSSPRRLEQDFVSPQGGSRQVGTVRNRSHGNPGKRMARPQGGQEIQLASAADPIAMRQNPLRLRRGDQLDPVAIQTADEEPSAVERDLPAPKPRETGMNRRTNFRRTDSRSNPLRGS